MGMPKADYGIYPFQECIAWALNHYRSARPKRVESESTEEARRALYDAQKEKYELENAAKKNELLDSNDVQLLLLQIVNTVSVRLDALPARVTNDAKERLRILGECRALQSELSRTLEDFAATYARRESDETPAPEDSGGVGGSETDTTPRQSGSRAVA